METLTHREMRNRSGEILRRVGPGESVLVSNNGHLAAHCPVRGDPLDGLIARGEAIPARTGTEGLADIARSVSPVNSWELLDHSRGRR